MKRGKLIPLLFLVPYLLLTALLISAVWNVLLQSLGYIPAFGLEAPTLRYYQEAFTRQDFFASLLLSLYISAISSVLALLLGLLLCAAIVRLRRGKLLLRLPILVPHTVTALFTICLFSQTGMLARLLKSFGWIADSSAFPQLLYTGSGIGVILAYLWKEIPFIAYSTMALMTSVRETLGEAAENLGASPLRAFFHVTLPLSAPAALRAFLIVFIFAFSGYELPLLLGATLPKALPVHAYLSYLSPDLLRRPYTMAVNGVTLFLSLLTAALYGLAMEGLRKKTGIEP